MMQLQYKIFVMQVKKKFKLDFHNIDQPYSFIHPYAKKNYRYFAREFRSKYFIGQNTSFIFFYYIICFNMMKYHMYIYNTRK